MLNDPPIHVADVKRPIGSGHGLDRSESLITGSEEFNRIVDRFRLERAVVHRSDLESLHEISGDFTDEEVSTNVISQKIVAVDTGTTSAGETGESSGVIEHVVLISTIDTRGSDHRANPSARGDRHPDTMKTILMFIANRVLLGKEIYEQGFRIR
jgi:hypothetical protein